MKGTDNEYPSPDTFPVSSFNQPVPPPSVDPDEGELFQVAFNPAWIPVLLAAAEQLTIPATWEGDHDQVILALNRAELLRYLLQEPAPVPAPYWDFPSSADDILPALTQMWYGEAVEELALLDPGDITFVQNLGIWGITAFIAYSGQIGAAIAFHTFAPRFVLAWNKSGVGGAIRVLIDGIDQGLFDTYDPAGGVMTAAFYPDEGIEEHEIIQYLETKPEGAPDDPESNEDAAFQLIRKRLTELETDIVTNLRQQAGSGQLEMERAGEWENVPSAENVRRDGTVVMSDALSVQSVPGIVARFNRSSTGGAIFNLGGWASDSLNYVRAAFTASLIVSAFATFRSRIMLNVRGFSGGTAEVFRGDFLANGQAAFGALGHVAAPQQTVVGSRAASPALASFLAAMAAYGWIVDSSTAGSVPGTRYNPDCDCFEITVDGGDTWVEDDEADPRHSDGSRLAPLTGGDEQCRAAEGMMQLVRETVTTRQDAVSAIELAGAILGIVAFIPGFNLLYALILGLATLAFTIGREILEAAFTEPVYDQIRCIFFCNIGADGQMDATQFAAAYAELIALEPISRTWVQSIMNTFGEVGLSDAGVMFEGAADCDCDCECENYSDPMTTELGEKTHIATWNATDISQFPVVPGAGGVYSATGGEPTGGYLASVLDPRVGGDSNCAIALIDLGRVCTVTAASWRVWLSSNELKSHFIAFFDASQTRIGFETPDNLNAAGWTGKAYTGAPVAGVRYIMIYQWCVLAADCGLGNIDITVA